MKWLRTRKRPTGRRALVIGAILNVLIPGLGHAYMLYLPRALVWFGGTIAVSAVLRGGDDNNSLVFGMALALGVLAALDLLLANWLESRSSGRL